MQPCSKVQGYKCSQDSMSGLAWGGVGKMFLEMGRTWLWANFLVVPSWQRCPQAKGLESLAALVTSVEETPDPIPTTISGAIPAWISGSFLRNGPGKFEFGEDRYFKTHHTSGRCRNKHQQRDRETLSSVLGFPPTVQKTMHVRWLKRLTCF